MSHLIICSRKFASAICQENFVPKIIKKESFPSERRTWTEDDFFRGKKIFLLNFLEMGNNKIFQKRTNFFSSKNYFSLISVYSIWIFFEFLPSKFVSEWFKLNFNLKAFPQIFSIINFNIGFWSTLQWIQVNFFNVNILKELETANQTIETPNLDAKVNPKDLASKTVNEKLIGMPVSGKPWKKINKT